MRIKIRDFYPVALFVLCLMLKTLTGTTHPPVSTPPANIWAEVRAIRSPPKTCPAEKVAWNSERSCPREQETWPKPAPRFASGSQSNFHLVRNN